MRGVFLDLASLQQGDLQLSELEALGVTWRMYPQTQAAEVAERIAECELVITNKVVLDEAALLQAPGLRLICVAATGTNNVDLEAARRLGITVCNVRGYGTPSVAQHVFSLLLALSGSLLEYRQDILNGRWQRHDQFCFMDHPMHELAGQTLGIVGYGELGQGVARLARAFDMQVLVAQRPGAAVEAGRLPLDELLPRVDVLSLHCPLSPETRNLIDATALARMRRGAILINTARGGIVDEAALAQALRSGRLGGAGIDVLAVEPPTQGNALLQADIPRLIVTPHIAWASVESRQRLLGQVVENIRAFQAQMPIRVVV